MNNVDIDNAATGTRAHLGRVLPQSQAMIVQQLTPCTVARVAKDFLDRLAHKAPFTYAWAIRWVSGKVGNYINANCNGAT